MATKLSKEIDRLAKEAGYPHQKLDHLTYKEILLEAHKNCNSATRSPTAHTDKEQEAFTGGQWKVDENQPAIVRINSFIRVEQVLELEKCPTANDYENFTQYGEAEANAALIANAKTLYYELKDILLYTKVKDGRAEWKTSEEKINQLKTIINRIKQH